MLNCAPSSLARQALVLDLQKGKPLAVFTAHSGAIGFLIRQSWAALSSRQSYEIASFCRATEQAPVLTVLAIWDPELDKTANLVPWLDRITVFAVQMAKMLLWISTWAPLGKWNVCQDLRADGYKFHPTLFYHNLQWYNPPNSSSWSSWGPKWAFHEEITILEELDVHLELSFFHWRNCRPRNISQCGTQ